MAADYSCYESTIILRLLFCYGRNYGIKTRLSILDTGIAIFCLITSGNGLFATKF